MTGTDISGLSDRALGIAESATLAITAKAAELRAQGQDVIGYGAAEPDFATPEPIVAAAIAAAADPSNHRYSPAAGLPSLRRAIANKTQRDSGFTVDPSQVIVTNGGKHAVYASLQVLVNPGDEVILPAPYWVSYPEAIKLAGGNPIVIDTNESSNFQVGIDQLDRALTARTRALIFVSPSNPTGTVYPPDAVQAVGEWAARNNVWVITDEIYEHLTYGTAQFSSLPVMAPEAVPRTVVVNGVAKTYAMTGWRVGWLIGPQEVAGAAARLQSHMTSNVNNVAQRAAEAAVIGPLDAVAEMRAAFDERRKMMHALLAAIDGVELTEPQGAFYAFPSVRGLLGREIGGTTVTTSLELAAALLEVAGIAFVPGEAFGAPGYARFSFALDSSDLEEGLRRMADALG